MDNNCYVTFSATYHAIRAEMALKDRAPAFKLVPVPRSISTDCGIALRCACSDLAAVRSALEQAGVEIAGIFGPADKENGRPGSEKGESSGDR